MEQEPHFKAAPKLCIHRKFAPAENLPREAHHEEVHEEYWREADVPWETVWLIYRLFMQGQTPCAIEKYLTDRDTAEEECSGGRMQGGAITAAACSRQS